MGSGMIASIFLIFVAIGAGIGGLAFGLGGLGALVAGTFLISMTASLSVAAVSLRKLRASED